MSESSGLVALNTGCSWPSRCIVRVVATAIIVVLVASPETTNADSQQYSVVARLDARSARLTPGEVVVRVGNMRVQATTIQASPEIPRNIAIVIDAGPNQANVLSRAKELATALVNELSDANTVFSIVRAGISPKTLAATVDRSIAIEHIREIGGDSGKRLNVIINDAIGSAIRQVSASPGLRIVIFIGEGNDGGSRLRYEQLRSLAESNQVAFFAALVADHSLRGAKSILRFGWNLQELTNDTGGIFLENPKTANAVHRLEDTVGRLRVITFEMPSGLSGRQKISVSSKRGIRLKAQEAVVIP